MLIYLGLGPLFSLKYGIPICDYIIIHFSVSISGQLGYYEVEVFFLLHIIILTETTNQCIQCKAKKVKNKINEKKNLNFQ